MRDFGDYDDWKTGGLMPGCDPDPEFCDVCYDRAEDCRCGEDDWKTERRTD